MKQVKPEQALVHKYPEWVILIVACAEDGTPNVMPAGWGMICSGDPLLVAVAIAFDRHTHRCIEETGEFIFAWAGAHQARLVKHCGSTSGAEEDKFEALQIPTAPAAVLDLPLLAEAAINLECKLRDRMKTGDHTIFVGEVVAAHLPDKPTATLLNFGGKFASGAPIDLPE
ncbi:MAG: flavin reductase family protein [candidate division WS1 bacterium]|jgi:flavin reductase (DIM6/NTAB) family NADH-FMN oxidoreductase RutF|nr:flavin reductase family protein [candidate division WS1 bacterium]